MKLNKFLNNIIVYSVIVSFLQNSTVYAESSAYSGHIQSCQKEIEPIFSSSKINSAANIHIPESYGTIEQKSGFEFPQVILIRDAHCNYDAQHNIANILKILINQYNINLIAVEGAKDIVDVSRFSKYSDEKVKEKIIDKFVKEGYVTGPEFLKIVKDKGLPFTLYGVEDTKIYQNNYKALQESLNEIENAEKSINELKSAVEYLKQDIFSDELKDFDRMSKAYSENKIRLTEWIEYLKLKVTNEMVKARRNFSLILRAIKLDKQIDFKKVEEERIELIKQLEKILVKEDLKVLAKKNFEFRLGKISSLDYYRHLEGCCDLGGYRHLKKYIKQLKLYSKLDSNKLIEEINTIREEIYCALSTDEKQKRLIRISKNTEILDKLVHLKLAPSDYEYYQANKSEFGQKLLQEIECLLSYKIPNINYSIFCNSDIFYQYAFSRNEIMTENLIKKMKNTGMAALVTGGFHTDGIGKILRGKGIPYVVVRPCITNIDEGKYFSLVKRAINVGNENLALPPFADIKNAITNALGLREESQELYRRFVTALEDYCSTGNVSTIKDELSEDELKEIKDILDKVWPSLPFSVKIVLSRVFGKKISNILVDRRVYLKGRREFHLPYELVGRVFIEKSDDNNKVKLIDKNDLNNWLRISRTDDGYFIAIPDWMKYSAMREKLVADKRQIGLVYNNVMCEFLGRLIQNEYRSARRDSAIEEYILSNGIESDGRNEVWIGKIRVVLGELYREESNKKLIKICRDREQVGRWVAVIDSSDKNNYFVLERREDKVFLVRDKTMLELIPENNIVYLTKIKAPRKFDLKIPRPLKSELVARSGSCSLGHTVFTFNLEEPLEVLRRDGATQRDEEWTRDTIVFKKPGSSEIAAEIKRIGVDKFIVSGFTTSDGKPVILTGNHFNINQILRHPNTISETELLVLFPAPRGKTKRNAVTYHWLGDDILIRDNYPDTNISLNADERLYLFGNLYSDDTYVSGLSSEEKQVLKYRLGDSFMQGLTLEEIASVMGCTRQNVNRIEENAIRKWRAARLLDLDNISPVDKERVLDLPVDCLPVSKRIQDVFIQCGIYKIRDLLEYDFSRNSGIRNFGKKSRKELDDLIVQLKTKLGIKDERQSVGVIADTKSDAEQDEEAGAKCDRTRSMQLILREDLEDENGNKLYREKEWTKTELGEREEDSKIILNESGDVVFDNNFRKQIQSEFNLRDEQIDRVLEGIAKIFDKRKEYYFKKEHVFPNKEIGLYFVNQSQSVSGDCDENSIAFINLKAVSQLIKKTNSHFANTVLAAYLGVFLSHEILGHEAGVNDEEVLSLQDMKLFIENCAGASIVGQFYYQMMIEVFERDSVFVEKFRDQLDEFNLLRDGGVGKGSVVVNAGTDNYYAIGLAAAQLGADYLGFDIDEGVCADINSAWEYYLPRIKIGSFRQISGAFSLDSAASSCIPNHSVDCVMMLTGVLSNPSHVSSAGDSLKEALRAVRHRGRIIAGSYFTGWHVEKNNQNSVIQNVLNSPEWKGKVELVPLKEISDTLGGFISCIMYEVRFTDLTDDSSAVEKFYAKLKMRIPGDIRLLDLSNLQQIVANNRLPDAWLSLAASLQYAEMFNIKAVDFLAKIGGIVEGCSEGLGFGDKQKALIIEAVCIYHFSLLLDKEFCERLSSDLDNIGYGSKADEIIRLLDIIKRNGGIKNRSDYYFINELEELLGYEKDEIFKKMGIDKTNLSMLRGEEGNVLTKNWYEIFVGNQKQWQIAKLGNERYPKGIIVQQAKAINVPALLNWLAGLKRHDIDLSWLELGFVTDGLSDLDKQKTEEKIRKRLREIGLKDIIFADSFSEIAENKKSENIVLIADEAEIRDKGDRYKKVKYIQSGQAGPVLELNLGITVLGVNEADSIKSIYERFLRQLIKDGFVLFDEEEVMQYVDKVRNNAYIYLVLPEIEKVLQVWDEFKEFEDQA
jgi:transcriptional regulator with XRE-family HTH domain